MIERIYNRIYHGTEKSRRVKATRLGWAVPGAGQDQERSRAGAGQEQSKSRAEA